MRWPPARGRRRSYRCPDDRFGGRPHRGGPQPLRRDLYAVRRDIEEDGYCSRPSTLISRRIRSRRVRTDQADLRETIGNPRADVLDIEAIAEVGHSHDIPLMIDNTFATRSCAVRSNGAPTSAIRPFIGGHGAVI